jgi:hypothetical protein
MEEIEDNDSDSNVLEKLKDHISLKFNLAYLIAIEKISGMLASAISGLLIVCFLTMFFFFASLALGYYLSELFNSFFYGFGAVALIYLLIAVALIFLRKKTIEKPFIDKFVQQLCKDIDLEENGK